MTAAPFEKIISEGISIVLQNDYGLRARKESIERFSGGEGSSEAFRAQLNDGVQIIIKESFWHTNPDTLEKIYSLSEALRDYGVLLPRVFRAQTAALLGFLRGHSVVVLEWIDGQPFSSRDKEYAGAGAALAAFHKAGLSYIYEHPRENNEIVKQLKQIMPYEESREMYKRGSLRADVLSHTSCSAQEMCGHVRENIKIFDDTARFVDASGVSDDALSRGIIHNDFNYGNVIYAHDGAVRAILDLEQIGIGPYVWDVANTLASFIWKTKQDNPGCNVQELTQIFLNSYHKIFQLSRNEYELIVPAIQRIGVMRILRMLRWHLYENDHLSALFPKIKKRFFPRLIETPQLFAFLTREWIEKNILSADSD